MRPIAGWWPATTSTSIYAAARLFVYPSLQEGFGFPPLEAMACGIPTISSLSTSMTENLRDAAELVPPDDVDALTQAMRRLLRDESRRATLRTLGLTRAARYRWDDTARNTVACSERAVQHERGKTGGQ